VTTKEEMYGQCRRKCEVGQWKDLSIKLAFGGAFCSRKEERLDG
jgi:hypothetical protein